MLLRVENKVLKMGKDSGDQFDRDAYDASYQQIQSPATCRELLYNVDKGHDAEQSEPREVQLPPAMHEITE